MLLDTSLLSFQHCWAFRYTAASGCNDTLHSRWRLLYSTMVLGFMWKGETCWSVIKCDNPHVSQYQRPVTRRKYPLPWTQVGDTVKPSPCIKKNTPLDNKLFTFLSCLSFKSKKENNILWDFPFFFFLNITMIQYNLNQKNKKRLDFRSVRPPSTCSGLEDLLGKVLSRWGGLSDPGFKSMGTQGVWFWV